MLWTHFRGHDSKHVVFTCFPASLSSRTEPKPFFLQNTQFLHASGSHFSKHTVFTIEKHAVSKRVWRALDHKSSLAILSLTSKAFWATATMQSTRRHDSMDILILTTKTFLNSQRRTSKFFPQALLDGFSKLQLRAKGKAQVGTCSDGEFRSRSLSRSLSHRQTVFFTVVPHFFVRNRVFYSVC